MTARTPKWPERHKRPGIAYAVTPEGLELPVIDLGNPFFSAITSDGEFAQLRERHAREAEQRKKIPIWIQRVFMVVVFRRSILGRGLIAAAGGFLDWQSTYLLKLPPDLLGRAYAGKIDRRIVESLPGASIRLRVRQMAELMAEDLATRLSQAPREAPLALINIGGGPAIDSLNALLLLCRRQPSCLAGRSVQIYVLDLKAEGATFGSRALRALQDEGGPLAGIDLTVSHTPYDWAYPEALKSILGEAVPPGTVATVSSEGALFEYGSDEEIVTNLQALHALLPAGTPVIGSVTRGDELARQIHGSGGARVIPRGLEVFGSLAQRGGWRVEQVKMSPLSDQVRMLMV